MRVPMLKRLAQTTLLGLMLGAIAQVAAAPLQLAETPLYLGSTVNPNVFFQLDDSGSMDFEITTGAYWDACRYDAAHPIGAGCSTAIRDDGDWYAVRWTESKLSTASTWAINTTTVATSGFVFMFDNNVENFYGDACVDGSGNPVANTNIPACLVTMANTTSTVRDQVCTGTSPGCTAPSGGSCSGSGASRRCYTAYYPLNHRRNIYSKDWRPYSSDFNVSYYDPRQKYEPWKIGSGETRMSDASFSAARGNPQSGQTGYAITRNLGGVNGVPFHRDNSGNLAQGFVYVVWTDSHGYNTSTVAGSPTAGPDKTDRTAVANGIVDTWDNHSRFVVTAAGITRYDVTYNPTATGLEETITGPITVTDDGTGLEDGSGLTGTNKRTLAQVLTNIANWYQYSRKRMLLTKGAVADVISDNDDFRFGLTMINRTGTTSSTNLFVEMPAGTVTDYGTHNTNLVSGLFNYKQAALGTPLIRGLDNAGRYYSHQTLYGSESTSVSSAARTSPIAEACQHNFTVLFTDGYWSDASDPATSGIDDKDGDGYSDGTRNTTLADVARFYRDHDIDTTKINSVPVGTDDNETTFQHMVTYTVAFGVRGELRFVPDPDEVIDAGAKILPNELVNSATGVATAFTPSISAQWGDNPWTSETGKTDDLWHAAYNSDGDFISARTAQDLVDGLRRALTDIRAATGSSSAVAASSGAYQSETSLYLAKFDSANWNGDIEQYQLVEVDGDVSVSDVRGWSAALELDGDVAGTGHDTWRKIATFNPSLVGGDKQGLGVPFRFPSDWQQADTLVGMGLSQLAHLMPNATNTTDADAVDVNADEGARLVAWLRGDTSLDGTTSEHGEAYRDRTSVLGDIVESSPQYVGAPDRFYPDALQPGEGNEYSAFRTGTASTRTPTLYVGANDGMLHAFRAADGVEQFAYIPSMVIKRLANLASPQYTHQYTVNSTVEINDVFINGDWHTVLVGGLGAGGQGIYALDITDPSHSSETELASSVLWEFSDTNHVPDTTAGAEGSNGDPNLGYTFSRPQLLKMANGKWMAVFGNGYNNTEADGSASITGRAYLYFVDIETGLLAHRIEVPVGSTTTPNGLSTVTAVDLNGDYVADYIYGGDLYGNLWRFDVNNSSMSNWRIAYSNSPIFTAQTGQPISTKPSVARHPTGSGVLVLFGTGKYLEFVDAQTGSQTTQSFYSVWDNIGVSGLTYPVARSNMLQQSIQSEEDHAGATAVDGDDVRITSDTAINWSTQRGWYMDLTVGSTNNGEKVATDSIVRGDRIIFISIVPGNTVCEGEGDSWIYELDFADGSRLPYSPIDVNLDGSIDAADNVEGTPGGGFKQPNIITSPTILADTQNKQREVKVFSSSSGALVEMGESTSGLQGRRSWRQLR